MEIDASSINYSSPHTQVTRPFCDSCLLRGPPGPLGACVWRSGHPLMRLQLMSCSALSSASTQSFARLPRVCTGKRERGNTSIKKARCSNTGPAATKSPNDLPTHGNTSRWKCCTSFVNSGLPTARRPGLFARISGAAPPWHRRMASFDPLGQSLRAFRSDSDCTVRCSIQSSLDVVGHQLAAQHVPVLLARRHTAYWPRL
jgi:hypothetical protein